MKLNKVLIFALLLLAIFAIGVVSAGDNSTSDEVAIAEDDSSDILEDGVYYDDDFYVSVNENYTQSKSEWDSNEIIYIASYSQKNGTFKVSVDNEVKQSFNITNGYFSQEDDGNGSTYNIYFRNVYPSDLGLDLGKYNIKVKFEENNLIDTNVTLSQKEDFDIWVQNPYYCEQDYWNASSFIVIDSNNRNTGVLEIYVNGTSKISYAVVNGSFEEIADCSNKSRYISAADLLESYGTYRIQFNFTENGTTKTLRDEIVSVAEFEPTTNPKLDVYLYYYVVNLPADNIAYIYLPREATGKLTVSFNDVKDRVIEYSKGYAQYYINAWELNHLGNNTLTFTYTGDDFGTLTATVSCIVQPSITAPSYVSLGEEFTISMITHEWADGSFNVYDYNNNVKGKLLASGHIINRLSSVKLSSNVEGLNKFYLEFAYPGGYYPVIQEIYVVCNSENITVNVQDSVKSGSDVLVNITAPVNDLNFAYVTVDDENLGFFNMGAGEVSVNISNLSDGYHTISVQYNDGNYADSKLIGDVYSNTFKVLVGQLRTELTSANIKTVYNNAKTLVVTLKDEYGNKLVNKTIFIKLNGNSYKKTTDKNGQVKLSVNLPVKSYTANINFNGDSIYLKSTGSVKIVFSKAVPKMAAKSKTFKAKTKTKKYGITLKDNKGRLMNKAKVTLKVKGKTYKATTKKGKATFKITKLNKKGNFNAVVKYAGNSNYKSVSKKIKIKVK